MGCDIHGWVEKKIDGRWIGYRELKDRERNYHRFARLAGVRGDGPDAKGLPSDLSETAKAHVDEYGSDGHSHSYMELNEAFDVFKSTTSKDLYSFWDAFGFDDDTQHICRECRRPLPDAEFRLVFWFDN